MTSDKEFWEGDRVRVFDSSLFKDDVTTPLSFTVREATVVCHYGKLRRDYGDDLTLGPYESLIDVVFDYKPNRVSHGHFTTFVEKIGEVRRND